MYQSPAVLRFVNGFVAIVFSGVAAATFVGTGDLSASSVLAAGSLAVAAWAVLGVVVPAIGPARVVIHFHDLVDVFLHRAVGGYL